MKKLSENRDLIHELLEAWSEEVNEPIKEIYISDNSYVGWAELESMTIFHRDIKILDETLNAHDLQISTISMNNDSLEIWFMPKVQ